MIPVQDVLHRIQWDPAQRGSRFEIGYLDRVAGTIVRVPFGSVQFERGRPAALSLRDADGIARLVPIHRVREVWQDGRLIWTRARGGGQPR